MRQLLPPKNDNPDMNRSGFERFMDFASDNVYLAGGFTGGFFLGIASS